MQLSKQMATVIKNTGEHYFAVGAEVQILRMHDKVYQCIGPHMDDGLPVYQLMASDEIAIRMPYNPS